MTNIRAKKVILKNRDGEHLVPITDVDALNYKNITNCLLEVPQNIKLELNDGVLTLKAGSKVIVPNGFEEDGTTPRFDYVTVPSDATYVEPSTAVNTLQIFYIPKSNALIRRGAATQSGTEAPSGFNSVYYNTATNHCNNYKSGTKDVQVSFPIAICTSNGQATNNISKIDQVFNGMGYIGSTVWVDKGVKGLIPNGRNEDGSLKNIEFTRNQLTVINGLNGLTTSTAVKVNVPLVIHYDDERTDWWIVANIFEQENVPTSTANYLRWYKPSENKWYERLMATDDWYEIHPIIYAHTSWDGSAITNFNPKEPFHVADYNDLQGKVSKTGDTMSGKLSFNGVPEGGHIIMTTNRADIVNVRTHHPDFDFTTTTAPSAHKYLQRFIAYDKNNQYTSYIEAMHHTNNKIFTNVGVRRSISGTAKTAYLQVGIDANGNPYTYAPHCNVNNGIVTQAGLSKATNGYCKFGNGLILQWGVHSSGSGGGEYTITLPTAFSNTNYSVVGVSRGDKVSNSDYQVHFKITSKTQFKKTGQVATGLYWFAIGY